MEARVVCLAAELGEGDHDEKRELVMAMCPDLRVRAAGGRLCRRALAVRRAAAHGASALVRKPPLPTAPPARRSG